jgi:TRAP-type C4-dicarboxylate transport system substrate-binding protein
MALLNLSEVLGGVTRNGAFGAPTNNYWMRRDQFNSLDADLQDAILEAGAYASSEGAAAMQNSVESHFEAFSDAGVDVYDLPSSMVDSYLPEKYQAVEDAWLDQIGGDAGKILEQWEAALN